MDTRGHRSALHDFIEVFPLLKPRIYDICVPPYQKGLSATEIAAQTKIPRKYGLCCHQTKRHFRRPLPEVPVDGWRRGKTLPAGIAGIKDSLLRDKDEFPVAQLILDLYEKGSTIGEITRTLNEKCIPTKMKKQWTYGVVQVIIKRSSLKE